MREGPADTSWEAMAKLPFFPEALPEYLTEAAGGAEQQGWGAFRGEGRWAQGSKMGNLTG